MNNWWLTSLQSEASFAKARQIFFKFEILDLDILKLINYDRFKKLLCVSLTIEFGFAPNVVKLA